MREEVGVGERWVCRGPRLPRGSAHEVDVGA